MALPRPALQACAFVALVLTVPAAAQDREERDTRPKRTRVGLGPQLVPSYPGSDQVVVRPFVDFSRARGDDPFIFEAPDDSADIGLFNARGFSAGPALNFQGDRSRRELGADLPNVPFTVELGGFVQAEVTPSVRLRAEARRGVGGHDGWIGFVGADYVARDGDDWLFSIGPRVVLADGRYQRAYFGVRPEDAVRTGLPVYRPKAGIEAVAAAASFLKQLTPRWGVSTYVRYERLVDDAGRSPVVRAFGSRNQYSGGIAATYTFGSGVRD